MCAKWLWCTFCNREVCDCHHRCCRLPCISIAYFLSSAPVSKRQYRAALVAKLKQLAGPGSTDALPVDTAIKLLSVESSASLGDGGGGGAIGTADIDLILVQGGAGTAAAAVAAGHRPLSSSSSVDSLTDQLRVEMLSDDTAKLNILDKYLGRAAMEIHSKNLQIQSQLQREAVG